MYRNNDTACPVHHTSSPTCDGAPLNMGRLSGKFFTSFNQSRRPNGPSVERPLTATATCEQCKTEGNKLNVDVTSFEHGIRTQSEFDISNRDRVNRTGSRWSYSQLTLTNSTAGTSKKETPLNIAPETVPSKWPSGINNSRPGGCRICLI